jgi:hypothetical protein
MECVLSVTIPREEPPFCLCPMFYYEIEGDPECYKCNRKCQTCNNPDTCLTCKTDADAMFPPNCDCHSN